MEDQTRTLEEQGENLMTEMAKSGELFRSISHASDLDSDRREKMVETLQNIMSATDTTDEK